ncbi:uncharacterized protein LOC106665937 isoform X3 [Cimex lectularius]|uniref:Uncharacterized protein n=1 Tax=Cimex lectularius TaxID=79782 RepID=A0A8I6RUE8_CIMLE|nr:uncharacterized protein LOC106665937 isoform X3 [Cimex lectularius]
MFGLQLAKTSPVFNRSDFLVASQQIAINSKRPKGRGRFEPAKQAGLSANDSLDVQQCSANALNSKTSIFSWIRKLYENRDETPCEQDAFETDRSWKGYFDILLLEETDCNKLNEFGQEWKDGGWYDRDVATRKHPTLLIYDSAKRVYSSPRCCTFEYHSCDCNVPFSTIKSRSNVQFPKDSKVKSLFFTAIEGSSNGAKKNECALPTQPWLQKNIKGFLSGKVYESNHRGYHTTSILGASTKEKVEKLISIRSPISYMYVPEASHLQPAQNSVRIETIAKVAGFDFDEKAKPKPSESPKRNGVLNKLMKSYAPVREPVEPKANTGPKTPLQRLMMMQSNKSKRGSSFIKKLNYKVPHDIEFLPYPTRKFHSKSNALRTRCLKTKTKPRSKSFQLLKHQILPGAKEEKAVPKYKVILIANQTKKNPVESPKKEAKGESAPSDPKDPSTKPSAPVEKSDQKKKVPKVKMDAYGDYERNDKAACESSTFISYIRKKKYQKA